MERGETIWHFVDRHSRSKETFPASSMLKFPCGIGKSRRKKQRRKRRRKGKGFNGLSSIKERKVYIMKEYKLFFSTEYTDKDGIDSAKNFTLYAPRLEGRDAQEAANEVFIYMQDLTKLKKLIRQAYRNENTKNLYLCLVLSNDCDMHGENTQRVYKFFDPSEHLTLVDMIDELTHEKPQA